MKLVLLFFGLLTNRAVSFVPVETRMSRPGAAFHRVPSGLFEQVSQQGSSPQTIPLETLFERTLDTVEDALLHAGRIPYDKGWIEPKPNNMKTVVVLGSGWGAHALIKVADTSKLRVIVVSPTNHFVFTPMLPCASVGTVEYRSLTEAVRASNPSIENYVQGKAVDIDIEKKTIKVQPETLLEYRRSGKPELCDLAYDQLVVAVGCKVADHFVPGASEYTYKLKTLDDSKKLRNAVGECLEFGCRPNVAHSSDLSEQEAQRRRQMRRDRLRFVVVGGGPTGVELAGELSDFFKDCTRDRVGPFSKLKDDISILLVEGASTLVPQFDQELRDYALKTLRSEGIDVKLETFVDEVGDGWIRLKDPKTGEQETLEVGIAVWAAGVGPVPFVDTLLSKLPPEASGRNGRIKVDQWLRCPTPTPETFGSILVLGDSAHFEKGADELLPQNAQVAGQQGAYVARMLGRGYDLSLTSPMISGEDFGVWMKARGLEEAPGFRFLNLGVLAYLGQGEALSQVQLGDVPLLSYAGSASYVLWRSAYLVKQVATRNRMLVSFDWMKCKLFGRDITRL